MTADHGDFAAHQTRSSTNWSHSPLPNDHLFSRFLTLLQSGELQFSGFVVVSLRTLGKAALVLGAVWIISLGGVGLLVHEATLRQHGCFSDRGPPSGSPENPAPPTVEAPPERH